MASLVGCSKPEITVATYDVPQAAVKHERQTRAALRGRERTAQTQTSAAVVQRMLAALVPQPNGTRIWSFKLTGEPQAVGGAKDDFKALLGSLTWPAADAKLPDWKLPTGWKAVPANDAFGKVAVIEFLSGETALAILGRHGQ
ncbi:MAG: hypothetical protein QM811_15880 [Pirellulales bacterium]